MTDQRRRGARRVAMGVGGLAAFIMLVAACGIQPTTVVDAGTPPSGAVPSRSPAPVTSNLGGFEPAYAGEVYFVSAAKVAPVRRPNLLDRAERANRDGRDIDLVTQSLQELLVGPSTDEVATGMVSELRLRPSPAPLRVISPDPDIVRVFMDMVTDDLSPLAALQITCTVGAAAKGQGRRPDVLVLREDEDGRLKPLPRCTSNGVR